MNNNLYPIQNSPAFFWYNFIDNGDYLCIAPEEGLTKLMSLQLISEQSQNILGELLFRRWLYSGCSKRPFTSIIKKVMPDSLLKSFDEYISNISHLEFNKNELLSHWFKNFGAVEALDGSFPFPERPFDRVAKRMRSFANSDGYICIVTTNKETVLLPFKIEPGNPLITDINSNIIHGWMDYYARLCTQYIALNRFSIQIQCNLGKRFTSGDFIKGPSFCLPVILAYEQKINKRFGNLQLFSVIATGDVVGKSLKTVEGIKEKQHLARKVGAQLFIAPTSAEALDDKSSLFLCDGKNIYECIRQIETELENRKLIKWDWDSASQRFYPPAKNHIDDLLSKGFIGRHEERRKIQEFCLHNNGKILFISGHPGIGKSALMAQAVKEVASGVTWENDAIERCPKVMAYFIRNNDVTDLNNALMFQLKSMFPDLEDLPLRTFSQWQGCNAADQLLCINLKHNPATPCDRLILFLDGIDQSNEIAKYIPTLTQLPWLTLIMSGRSIPLKEIGYDGDYTQVDIGTLDDDSAKLLFNSLVRDKNIQDLTDIWKQAAMERAKGLPIYLVTLANWIIHIGKCPSIKDIPPSLEKLYEELINSISQYGANQDVLDVICFIAIYFVAIGAYEGEEISLTCDMLSEYFDKNIVEMRNILVTCAPVLTKYQLKRISLFHITFTKYVYRDLHAFQWLRNKAEKGHAFAQYYLARIYDEVVLSKESYECRSKMDGGEVVDEWLPGTPQTVRERQVFIEQEVMVWLAKASRQEVMVWLTKAAEQGFGQAQNKLGQMYSVGYLGSKDEASAAKWYTEAAEQGHIESQIRLGVMCAEGQGIPQNGKAAIKWLTKAAEQRGNPLYAYALLFLGLVYVEGLIVPKDKAIAAKLITKAAEEQWLGLIENGIFLELINWINSKDQSQRISKDYDTKKVKRTFEWIGLFYRSIGDNESTANRWEQRIKLQFKK